MKFSWTFNTTPTTTHAGRMYTLRGKVVEVGIQLPAVCIRHQVRVSEEDTLSPGMPIKRHSLEYLLSRTGGVSVGVAIKGFQSKATLQVIATMPSVLIPGPLHEDQRLVTFQGNNRYGAPYQVTLPCVQYEVGASGYLPDSASGEDVIKEVASMYERAHLYPAITKTGEFLKQVYAVPILGACKVAADDFLRSRGGKSKKGLLATLCNAVKRKVNPLFRPNGFSEPDVTIDDVTLTLSDTPGRRWALLGLRWREGLSAHPRVLRWYDYLFGVVLQRCHIRVLVTIGNVTVSTTPASEYHLEYLAVTRDLQTAAGDASIEVALAPPTPIDVIPSLAPFEYMYRHMSVAAFNAMIARDPVLMAKWESYVAETPINPPEVFDKDTSLYNVDHIPFVRAEVDAAHTTISRLYGVC